MAFSGIFLPFSANTHWMASNFPFQMAISIVLGCTGPNPFSFSHCNIRTSPRAAASLKTFSLQGLPFSNAHWVTSSLSFRAERLRTSLAHESTDHLHCSAGLENYRQDLRR